MSEAPLPILVQSDAVIGSAICRGQQWMKGFVKDVAGAHSTSSKTVTESVVAMTTGTNTIRRSEPPWPTTDLNCLLNPTAAC
jgi:hypothetical protein